jgi:stage II sporulation protein E
MDSTTNQSPISGGSRERGFFHSRTSAGSGGRSNKGKSAKGTAGEKTAPKPDMPDIALTEAGYLPPSQKLKILFFSLAAFACGLLLSSAEFFGRSSPLATAMVAGLSGVPCMAGFAGGVVGFLLKGGNTIGANSGELSQIASMMAVGAFRLVFCWKPARWSNIASAALSGVTVACLTAASAARPFDYFAAGAFGLVAAAGSAAFTYITASAGKTESQSHQILRENKGRLSLWLICALGLSALSALTLTVIVPFNVGVIAVCVMTLAFAAGKQPAGAAFAAAAGIGLAIAEGSNISVAFSVVVAGMLASLCRDKRLGAAAFMLSFSLCTAALGWNEGAVMQPSVFLACLIAAVLPVEIPIQTLNEPVLRKGGNLSGVFAQRLKMTGRSLGEVKTAIEKTAQALEKNAKVTENSEDDLSRVYIRASDEVCRTCRHNMICWGGEYNETAKGMCGIVDILRRGDIPSAYDFSDNLRIRCERTEQMLRTVNAYYREYVAKHAAKRKIARMRSVLTAQLLSTERMMDAMAEEFAADGAALLDEAASAAFEKLLRRYGLSDVKAAVREKNGHVFAEGYGQGTLHCTAVQLGELMEQTLLRDFDLPEIAVSGGEYCVTAFERAAFTAEIGVHQISKGKEKYCGDCFDSFTNAKGQMFVILSDGMGSGSRARVDSAFACGMMAKLLRADVRVECAAEVVNNALCVKSEDESFATLDICVIDLFTGRVEVYKAGGAPTYIKCGRKMTKLEGGGIPAGVRQAPIIGKQSFTAGESDMILMVSDGAELNEQWLGRQIAREQTDMNALAQSLSSAARYAAEKGREDDVSVIAIKIGR